MRSRGQDTRGEYELETLIQEIKNEIGTGEGVIIDTRDLSPDEASALKQRVRDEGLTPYVMFFP